MRGRINAARQSADDDNPGAREIERNLAGRDQAFLRRGPRTNHRDAGRARMRAIAAGPDARGRVGNLRQQLRIFRSAEMDAVHAENTGDCP